MRKYRVDRLFVVEGKRGNFSHYFICKYNERKRKYVEIFTNTEMNISETTMINSLAEYFSILGRRNYSTGKPLTLDKKKLLQKYTEINDGVVLKRGWALPSDSDSDIKIDKILENATNFFFPDNGAWGAVCFQRPTDWAVPYIPCHLNDDVWVAQALKKTQDLLYLSTDRVLDFVEKPFFQDKKHAYGLKIVKWQIEWMLSGGDSWLVADGFDDDYFFRESSVDIGFRKSVIKTLLAIGMPDEIIEEGLERHSDLWYIKLLNQAFENEFNPLDVQIFLKTHEGSTEIPPVVPTFKNQWIALRMYEYYTAHKDSIDKYGNPHLFPKELDDETLKDLKNIVSCESIMREQQIKKFREDRTSLDQLKDLVKAHQ